MFSIFKNLFNVEKLIDSKVKAKVADTVKNQIAEEVTINADHRKQLVLINKNTTNLVGYDFQEAISCGLQNGNNNSQLLGQEVQQLLENNNINNKTIEAKLKNPEFLVAVTEASKAGYTETNVQKRKLLADLLFHKMTEIDDLENLNLSQAIKTMNLLTEEHLKCLSLILILRSKYIIEFVDIVKLNDFFNKHIIPLIDIDINKLEFVGMGLYTAGCATTFSFSSDAWDFFPPEERKAYNSLEELNRNRIDKFNELINIWQPASITCAHLTAIGNLIGQKYLELKTGLTIDIKNLKA